MTSHDGSPPTSSTLGAFEFRHLEALLSVGRTHSFSTAATELGYSQSAVSQQIARLERILGITLVERTRGHRRVSLTDAGEVLMHHAEVIAARLTSATADIDTFKRGEAGVLRIGCFQSVGVKLLPRILRVFGEAWPRIAIELTQAEDDAYLLDEVEAGRLDVTFMVLPLPEGPFAFSELLEDPYVVVALPGYLPAEDEDGVGWRDLIGSSLITYDRMRLEHAVENRIGRPELADQIVLRSHDSGTLLGMAAEGLGAAVVSWLSVPHGTEASQFSLSVFPLRNVNPRVVGIAWHRDRIMTTAVEDFIRIAKQESFNLNRG